MPGELRQAGPTGLCALPLELGRIPTGTGFQAVTAGQSVHFQAWHTDGGATGAVTRLTNGIRVDLN